MTTHNHASENGGTRSYDLLAVNLVAALITAVLTGGSLLMLAVASVASEYSDGGNPAWVLFVASFFIIVQMAGAMICAWHNHVSAAHATMRSVMGWISWIMTGVSLFFLFIILLLIPIVVATLDIDAF